MVVCNGNFDLVLLCDHFFVLNMNFGSYIVGATVNERKIKIKQRNWMCTEGMMI